MPDLPPADPTGQPPLADTDVVSLPRADQPEPKELVSSDAEIVELPDPDRARGLDTGTPAAEEPEALEAILVRPRPGFWGAVGWLLLLVLLESAVVGLWALGVRLTRREPDWVALLAAHGFLILTYG